MTTQNKRLAACVAKLLPLFVLASTASATAISWSGTGGGSWTDTAKWTPSQVPVTGDTVTFPAAGQAVTLNGNQTVDGLVFNNTSTGSLRPTVAGQVLSLGAGGIKFGTGQTDLGGSGAQALVIAMTANQSWTGNGGSLIQLNSGSPASTQSLTNATSGPITLTIDGNFKTESTKTISGAVDDGILGGTTALAVGYGNSTFGSFILSGNNTYTGGTTFRSGFLVLGHNSALGGSNGSTTGVLTITGGTMNLAAGNATATSLYRDLSSNVPGGITVTGNNPQVWASDFRFIGSYGINFGTGPISIPTDRKITLNLTTNQVAFTFGGDISGAGKLTFENHQSGLTNALLRLDGTNTYTGGTTINGGTVRFGSAASVPSTGAITMTGGGAIAVGGAYATLADITADTRITKTGGAYALAGDSAEAFTPPNANISLGAQLGSVAKYTGTLTSSGTNYQVGGGGGTILFPNDGAFTGTKSINVLGAGTVIISGQNDVNGNGGNKGVYLSAGVLQVSSINNATANVAATSNLGAPSGATNGQITMGAGGPAVLRYTGPGENTDRNIIYSQSFGSSIALDASGTGALTFNGTYSVTAITGSGINRTLVLRGINTGANSFAGSLVNGTSSTAGTQPTLAISKQARGSWTLTGANTNNATITVAGGTLTADYATNASVLGGSNALALGGGTFAIKGNPSGSTAQTLGNPNLTASTGQSQITVNGNGGANSAALTLGNTWTRNTATYLNLNLLNGGTVTATPALSNSVVVGSSTVAAFTVTDSTGTDFAALSTGKLAKLAATTALPATASGNTTNYVLSGDLTLGGAAAVNTLRIDTSSATGTLTLGANPITAARGEILMSGANDYTISGTQLAPSAGTIGLSNYGPGKLTVASAITSGAGVFTKTGPGLIDVTGNNTASGATNIFGGVLRLSNATYSTGNILLNTGGILEIAADTNGAAAGDFSRTIGTSGSQITWGNGDGGFSAFGGNRIVNLGGLASPQTLAWGSTTAINTTATANTGGLATPFVRDGQALLLSSSTSDSTIEFQNPIDLVNVPRAIVVGNGAASVDAILSGVLSSSDFSGGVDKLGAGTLNLRAANTYTGETRILEGTLVAGIAGAIPASSTVVIPGGTSSAGTLDLNGFDATIGGLSGVSGTVPGKVVNNTAGANKLTLGGGNATATFSGLIADNSGTGGTVAVEKIGTGTETFTGSHTYTGGTTITGGTLVANLPLSGSIVFNGGTLVARLGNGTTTGWSNAQIDTLLSTATQTSGGLGLDTTNGDTTFASGALGGALGFTKFGPKTLTFTGNSTSYTGPTIIKEGTLAVTLTGDIALSTNSVVGNSATPIVLGTSSTIGAQTNGLQFTAGSDNANYTIARGIDISSGTSSSAPTVSFTGDGLNGLNTNTVTLAGDIALGSRTAGVRAQRSGITVNITGNVTQASGAGAFTLNAFPLDPNVDGRGVGTIRFSNSTRNYAASNNLIGGRVVIDGVVGAVGTASPIGLSAINLNQGTGGNIVGWANFSAGAAASRDTSVDAIRSIFLESSGSSYARPIAPGAASVTTIVQTGSTAIPASYASNVSILNGYQFGGLNTSGTVSFLGEIAPTDALVGASPTNVVTTGANIALIAQAGGSVLFNGVISDTPSPTTARVTINQFRNHPNIDGVNNTSNLIGADGIPDATADQLVGTPTTGTVILAAANIYEGNTEVLGGTLLATNTTGSATGFGALTVASGAKLAGTGIIAPTGTNGITVANGGSLNLLDGATGNFNVNLNGTSGGTTFASGATLAFELDAPGTSDKVIVTGAAGSTVTFNSNVVDLLGLAGAAAGDYTLFTFDANTTYTGTLVAGSLPSGITGATFTYNASDIKVTLAATVTSLYDTWKAGKFTEDELLNSAISGSSADPDKDGLSNLLEYAFGTEPRTSNVSPVTTAPVGGVLRMSFPYIADPTITYTVKATNDLVTGFPSTGTNYTGFTGTGTQVHNDSATLATTPRRFLRLEVTAP